MKIWDVTWHCPDCTSSCVSLRKRAWFICLIFHFYLVSFTDWMLHFIKPSSSNNLIFKCLLERDFARVATGNAQFSKTLRSEQSISCPIWRKITLISNECINLESRYTFCSWGARSKVNFFKRKKDMKHSASNEKAE